MSYGRTIDKSTVYTIMDKNQQAVIVARLDKIKDIGVYFDAKLDFKGTLRRRLTYIFFSFNKKFNI